jgi:DoxX-like protein
LAIVIVLAVVTVTLFLSASLLKLTDQPQAREGQAKFGISAATYKRIGMLELLGVIGVVAGLAVPLIGVAAGVGLVAVAGGALVNHLRVKDTLPAVMSAIIAMAAAAGYVVARVLSA